MPEKRAAALGFIFITILVDVIGLGILIPVIPDLLKEITGEGLSKASVISGWLIFAFAAMQFVFAPLLGSLSDKFGRRPVLLIALAGLGIDYLIHAWAPTLIWLFAGRILAGMAGASFTTANAYIADISSPEKRAQNFGLVGAAFGLGFIIGPLIGGVFSQWGTRLPFIVAAGLAFMNFLYGLFVLPESLSLANRRSFDWKRANPIGALTHLKKYPALLGLIFTVFLVHLAGHSVQSTWTFYTMLKFDWDATAVGYSLAFVGLLVAIVQGGLIRVVIPWLGQRLSIYIGMFFWLTGLTFFAFAPTGFHMMAFLVPYALGGIAGPTIQGIISNQVPGNEQGELHGALTSMISITSILGPLLMTGLFHHFTSGESKLYFPGSPFLMGSIIIIISIVLIIPSLRHVTKGYSTT